MGGPSDNCAADHERRFGGATRVSRLVLTLVDDIDGSQATASQDPRFPRGSDR